MIMPARDGAQLRLDRLLARLSEVARLLPALTAHNGHEERRRLVACVERGDMAVPRWEPSRRRLPPETWRWLEEARALAPASPASRTYLDRLDELELDLCMIEALGDARRVRPLAARRFGTGSSTVPTADGELRVARVAAHILETVELSYEPHILPASGLLGEPSLAELVRLVAARAGLEVEVRVEPRLVASAATGERVVFIADRWFGAREALRLAVHEVLGHLVAAANGRAQPLRILELGTAGSFGDQEGVALWLEEQAGVLDGLRLKTLAARVHATDQMHAGAHFGEVARELVRDHGFCAADAVAVAERAWRGGGVARDVGYLRGWLRVRAALESGDATLDELRSGRVGLADLPTLRALEDMGLFRPAVYRPSLAYSLAATDGGTSLLTSPPSVAASFTRFELT